MVLEIAGNAVGSKHYVGTNVSRQGKGKGIVQASNYCRPKPQFHRFTRTRPKTLVKRVWSGSQYQEGIQYWAIIETRSNSGSSKRGDSQGSDRSQQSLEEARGIQRLNSADDHDGTLLRCEGERTFAGKIFKRIVNKKRWWRIPNFLEAFNRTLLTVRVTKQTDERKIGEEQMICVERWIFCAKN